MDVGRETWDVRILAEFYLHRVSYVLSRNLITEK
ncbi:hypothetical protein Psfp_02807 [Pelotomaculum sp. FP]|nr:hypothetical protein Psfp_02807 [Pelotomaculum sp. FP]